MKTLKSENDRFAVDVLLRNKGFKIWERKEGVCPIWEKNGILYDECEALDQLKSEEVADAEYSEFTYWES